ncbi:MAG: hypothetical protein JNM62_14455 [Flavobacteriales bacterium]|nr:hypothetical protein [Flavobacteriales bacterium]
MEHRPHRVRRIFQGLLTMVVLGIVAVITWAWAYGGPWLDRTIRERIETAVREAAVQGYHFEMDSLNAEFMSGDVRINGIRLTYDSTLNDSLRAGTYDYLFSARASTIALRGLSIWRAVLYREVHLRAIEVDTPAFHYTIGDRRVALNSPFKRLGRSDTKSLRLFTVDALTVRGAKARMHDLSGHLPVLRASGLDIVANDLDVLRPGDKKRADLNVGAVDIRMDSLSTDLPHGYRLRFGDTHLSDHLRRGSVRHLALERIDEKAPSHRITRVSVEVDSLVFQEPDVAGLLGDRALSMRSLGIHGMHLVAERDNYKPEGPARAVMLPPAALLAIPFPIRIDSVHLADGSVTYRERSDETGQWGTLLLNDVNASFKGIFNEIDGNEPTLLVGDIRCSFMDTAILNARYEARLDEEEEFTFTATMQQLALGSLDSLTSNLLRLSMVSGRLEHMHLMMKGDAESARGSMDMTYADVVTTVASNATNAQRHSMLGAVMDFVMTEERGGGLSDRQRRSVSIDRDPNRSLLTYIWHFTRAGIKRDMIPGATKRVFSLLKKERTDRRKRRRAR